MSLSTATEQEAHYQNPKSLIGEQQSIALVQKQRFSPSQDLLIM